MLLINVTNLYLVGQGYIFTKFLIQFLRWLCLCQLGMRASLPTEPVYATQNWQFLPSLSLGKITPILCTVLFNDTGAAADKR